MHTFNLRTLEIEIGRYFYYEFETSLVYIGSSRIARAPQTDHLIPAMHLIFKTFPDYDLGTQLFNLEITQRQLWNTCKNISTS